MTARHSHHLAGCRPEPLGSYLKALGVLRLVGEQADSTATGYWRADGFVLSSVLDDQELASFLLSEYRPTPVLSPWNSSSGFGPEGKDGLQIIETSDDQRLAIYRSSIAIARAELERVRAAGWPVEVKNWTKEQKRELVMACRSRLPDEALPWLDAAVVLGAGDGVSYPPLLGTGGNLGRLELSQNFSQHVVKALGVASATARGKKGARAGDSARWLEEALYALGRTSLPRGSSPGQFDPGSAGGVNSAPAGEADRVLNPWDFVLLVEGAVLFAGSATRRLGAGGRGRSSAPFMADSAAEGYPSASEDEPAKGEIWLPLWDRPTTLAEIRHLLAEGRADWRGNLARSGLDMAKAAASLGVDRGVRAFSRHVLVERFGQSTIAVPAGRVTVSDRRRPDVAPIADLDRWLDRVRYADNPPASVLAARRRVDRAAFEVATGGGAGALARLLAEAAKLEAAIAVATGFREKHAITPARDLACSRWAQALLPAAAESVELRLALALASIHDVDTTRPEAFTSLRTMLRPICHGVGGRPVWAARSPVEGLGLRPVSAVLADAHARRVVDLLAARRSSPELPEQIGVPTRFDQGLIAPLHDVEALVAGTVDEEILADFLAGCMLIDWRGVGGTRARLTSSSTSIEEVWSPALSVLGPFYAEHERSWGAAPLLVHVDWDRHLAAKALSPEARWPALLAAGQAGPVIAAAVRRLRIAGFDPVVRGDRVSLGVDPDRGRARRLGAALMCRLSWKSRLSLLRRSCPDPDLSNQNPKEHSHAQT